ncbi:TetR/AcrR family transcriptional regulator [Nonomuraea sp. MCN248]|uniref:TetR/AcrR family transcriptional regulator n=1 Tax=Nonomuraea corallina TaxID=2989783 RepID=A0ABT4S934_9ACTN|nr:TetR/AcrR family transcriptional regulator [Nonomuraea corallina]MDA0633485.1 TetR/AcrR family transcriptional regulator [Nonomuraea corallina]
MPTARGRIDKRQAILDAAITVFARRGYDQACVQEIADEAGVAKPTVYNHLTDKATLFREAMTAATGAAVARHLATLDRLAVPGDDLRTVLEEVALDLLRCHCDERSRAVRRLLHAETARFPDLLSLVRGPSGHRVTEALADRLARLALAGRLRGADPSLAAEQLIALLTGPADLRWPVSSPPDDDLATIAHAAVDTFLRAFAADPPVSQERAIHT